ncbi:MAG: hypothetical protein PHD72_04455 [Patescibacteria group bacterium]|nr:hypothetical protein [Patescibacteria group bacterium]
MRQKFALALLPLFVVIGLSSGLFLFSNCANAAGLTMTPVVAGTDNLIGAADAKWVFTATTTGALNRGEVLQFSFPSGIPGQGFTLTNGTVTATASTGVILASSLGAPVNLLTNPSFEPATSSWNPLSGGVGSAVTTTYYHGAKARQFDFVGPELYMLETQNVVSLSNSATYTVSFYAQGRNETETARLMLLVGSCGGGNFTMYNFTSSSWDCAALNTASTSPYFLNSVVVSSTAFTRFSRSFLSHPSSGNVTVVVGNGGDAFYAGEMIMIDAVQLERANSATAFTTTDSAATVGVLVGPGMTPKVYGYVSTTVDAGTLISVTLGGVGNPVAQRQALVSQLFTMSGGAPVDAGQPYGSLSGTPGVNVTGEASIIRAGGSFVIDGATGIFASNSVTSTAANYTFNFTPTSSIPVGGKIVLQFPSDYNSLLGNITINTSTAISTAGATTSTIASYTMATSTDGARLIKLVVAGQATEAGDPLSIVVGNVMNPATAGVYGGESGGPAGRFSQYTTKANDGLLDGSSFGNESGDFAQGQPNAPSSIHIGGYNNVTVVVYKQSNGSNVALSESDRAQVKVMMGCPDRMFFVGERFLDSNSSATFQKILDCNYMIGVQPFNMGSSSFYDSFLVPGMKSVAAFSGVSVTTSVIFGVPDTTTTLSITGGVQGQVAFVNAFTSDFQSFTPVFTDTSYVTPGFSSTGTGYAILKTKSGYSWSFNVESGNYGNAGNFQSAGVKYWPPVIPSYYIATSGTLALGAFPYVQADKNLVVSIKRAGTEELISNACVGVKRSGGGMFMGSQDTICQPNFNGNTQYLFKVPSGAITIEVARPGMGRPEEYPVAINTATTTKIIGVAAPTSFISVTVQDSSGTKINGAPVFAHGTSFAQGMTGSTGTTTIYVPVGTYMVDGFAPGLGPLTQTAATVTGGSNPSVTFTVNTGNLKTITGRVTQGGSGLSGIKIGARGTGATTGGNGTETDSNGDFILRVPAGTYEVGGWSSDTGGLPPKTANASSGNVTLTDWTLGGRGTLHIEITNASNVSPLFAGAFDPTTNRGNGTDTWTASGTSKVANIYLPAGTYEVNAGSPQVGPIIERESVTITSGATTNVSANAQGSVTLITLSGTVASTSTGVPNVTVWASGIAGSPGFYSTLTDANGAYSLKVPTSRTYRMGARVLGYVATIGDFDAVVTTSDQVINIAMTVSGASITGQIVNATGTAITDAWVSAKKTVGSNDVWMGAPTDGNGNFTLNVDPGSTWTVFAEGPCYYRSAGTSTSAGSTSANITLISVPGCSKSTPTMQGVSGASGGQVSKDDIILDIPANALSTANSTISVSLQDVDAPKSAANATAVLGAMQSITAQDSSSQAITTLNNNVSLTINYDEANLPIGFDETKLQLGYFDTNSGQYEPMACTVNTTTNQITAQTSHFTDIGPILPNVPEKPTGLTATAASASQINLSWTAQADADYYVIYRTTTPTSTFYAGDQLATTTAVTYNNTLLTASTTYYYEVAGYNSYGEGSNSDTASATTSAASYGVTVTQSGGSTAVTEGGATDSYTLVLTAVPSANVVITVAASGGKVSLSTSTVTFTVANYDVAQTITVTAVDDSTIEGTHTDTITHTVASSDVNYNGISVSSTSVTITDNDISGSGGSTGGGGAPVADTTAPTNTSIALGTGVQGTATPNITIFIAATDATHMMLSNSADFTGGTWANYATSSAWTLTSGAGVKTVYAKFKDAAGNVSTPVSLVITLTGSETPTSTPLQPLSTGTGAEEPTGGLMAPILAVVIDSSTSPVAISNISEAVYQPGQKVKFTYQYKNETSAKLYVKIVRQILNSKGKAVKSLTAYKTIAKGATFSADVSETLASSLASGKYTFVVKIYNARTGKIFGSNSFKITLKKRYFILSSEKPAAGDITFDAKFYAKIKSNVLLPTAVKLKYTYTNSDSKKHTVRMIRELLNANGKVMEKKSGKWVMTPGEKDSTSFTQTLKNTLQPGAYMVRIRAYDWTTNEVLAENSFGFNVELK